MQTGTTLGWTLEGEETLGGSKGCSDRAAYGRFRVTHAISRAGLRGPSGGRLGVGGGLFGVGGVREGEGGDLFDSEGAQDGDQTTRKQSRERPVLLEKIFQNSLEIKQKSP